MQLLQQTTSAPSREYHQQIPKKVEDAIFFGHLSRAAGYVFLALARYANQDCYCFPKRETIAKITNYSIPWVDKKIAELKAAGFIQVVRNPPAGNHYIIHALDGVAGKSVPGVEAPARGPARGPRRVPATEPQSCQKDESSHTPGGVESYSRRSRSVLTSFKEQKPINKREREAPPSFNILEFSKRYKRTLKIGGNPMQIREEIESRLHPNIGYTLGDMENAMQKQLGGGLDLWDHFESQYPRKKNKAGGLDIDGPEPRSEAEAALIERKKAAQEIQREKEARQEAAAAKPKLSDEEIIQRGIIAFEKLSPAGQHAALKGKNLSQAEFDRQNPSEKQNVGWAADGIILQGEK